MGRLALGIAGVLAVVSSIRLCIYSILAGVDGPIDDKVIGPEELKKLPPNIDLVRLCRVELDIPPEDRSDADIEEGSTLSKELVLRKSDQLEIRRRIRDVFDLIGLLVRLGGVGLPFDVREVDGVDASVITTSGLR